MKNINFLVTLLGIFLLSSYGCQTQQESTTTSVAPKPIKGVAQFDYVLHSPIHPATDEPVTFRLSASDSDGIAKVELKLYEYELYRNEFGFPSKRIRPEKLNGSVRTWTFDGLDTQTVVYFLLPQGFPKHSNCEYLFRITNTSGVVSDRLVSFDAGESPWPDDKILLYAQYPEGMASDINICFIPDVDFGGDWPLFLEGAEKLIYEGYHENNMIKDYKHHWAFYVTKQEMNGIKLTENIIEETSFPDFLTTKRIEGIDAFGLLHQQPFKDGAYLKGNLTFLAYNLFTAESFNLGTAVHETAHAIFNLSDEYNGCVCFQPSAGANMFRQENDCEKLNERIGRIGAECTEIHNHKNEKWYMAEENPYFANLADCQNHAKANGLDPTKCGRYIENGVHYYRSEDVICIMQDDGDTAIRPFKPVCASIIKEVYNAFDANPRNYALTTSRDNMYGYEPVIVMEFSVDDKHKSQLVVDRVVNGIPTKSNGLGGDYDLTYYDNKDKVNYELHLPSPNEVIVHGSSGENGIKQTQPMKRYISIPYCEVMSKVRCVNHPTIVEQETLVRNDNPSGTIVEDINISEEVDKAFRDFARQTE